MTECVKGLGAFPGSDSGQAVQLHIYLTHVSEPETPIDYLTAPFNEGLDYNGWNNKIEEGEWGRIKVSADVATAIARSALETITTAKEKTLYSKMDEGPDKARVDRAYDLLAIAVFIMAGQVEKITDGKNRGSNWRSEILNDFELIHDRLTFRVDSEQSEFENSVEQPPSKLTLNLVARFLEKLE